MKIQKLLITGTCIAALTLCLPIANAQTPSPSPKPKATEKAEKKKTEKADTATAEKPPRSIPFRGTVTSVDNDAKTFTIAGKTTTRIFRVTDKTTITKDNADAEFSDITAETYVTGSYWKGEGDTHEARSVKVGGPGAKAKKTTKKKKADEEEEGEGEE